MSVVLSNFTNRAWDDCITARYSRNFILSSENYVVMCHRLPKTLHGALSKMSLCKLSCIYRRIKKSMRYETFVVHHISQDFADFLFKVKLIELKCNTRDVTILFSLILRDERISTLKSAFLMTLSTGYVRTWAGKSFCFQTKTDTCGLV